MDTKIVKYSSNLYSQLYAILKKNYNSTISREILEKYYTGDNKYIFLAVYEDNVLGCAFLEIKEDYIRPYKYGYISYVAVDERYRKQGIGSGLVKHLISYAKEMSCSTVELTSANYRVNAHAFYKTLGFEKKKTTVFIKEPI